jgi:serine/threonine protein kinase
VPVILSPGQRGFLCGCGLFPRASTKVMLLPLEQARFVVFETALALAHLHRNLIVHKDVKVIIRGGVLFSPPCSCGGASCGDKASYVVFGTELALAHLHRNLIVHKDVKVGLGRGVVLLSVLSSRKLGLEVNPDPLVITPFPELVSNIIMITSLTTPRVSYPPAAGQHLCADRPVAAPRGEHHGRQAGRLRTQRAARGPRRHKRQVRDRITSE